MYPLSYPAYGSRTRCTQVPYCCFNKVDQTGAPLLPDTASLHERLFDIKYFKDVSREFDEHQSVEIFIGVLIGCTR